MADRIGIKVEGSIDSSKSVLEDNVPFFFLITIAIFLLPTLLILRT